ncbi:hypothetical protein C8R46DRAFT_1082022 [Mycena filopes]|nr:hypothetical protein C8R46DRAFT_1082022 [Mycena filopes]
MLELCPGIVNFGGMPMHGNGSLLRFLNTRGSGSPKYIPRPIILFSAVIPKSIGCDRATIAFLSLPLPLALSSSNMPDAADENISVDIDYKHVARQLQSSTAKCSATNCIAPAQGFTVKCGRCPLRVCQDLFHLLQYTHSLKFHLECAGLQAPPATTWLCQDCR